MQRTSSKRFVATALAAVFVLGLSAGVYARDVATWLEVRYRDIRITVDGRQVTTESEPFIVVEEGRTYVPARALAEALGASVEWDGDNATVVVTSRQPFTVTPVGDKLSYKDHRYNLQLSVPGTWLKLDNPSVAVSYADPVTASNVNVAVSPAEAGKSLDAQTDAVIETVKGMFKVDAISEKATTTVAGQSARRFELTLTAQGISHKQQVYVFVAHGNLYVMSLGASSTQFANFQSTFEAIRASVSVN